MLCAACEREAPESALFCPSCGAHLDIGSTPTLGKDAPPPVGGRPVYVAGVRTPSGGTPGGGATPTSGGSPSTGVKFTPGMILGERYRIVNLLGRGGMGEVYRADDLKLSQSVALKFLPVALAGDAAALERFHGEVRMARQVSHPSVCRVYDIGEFSDASGERPFLSMEYIDGEDLGSLLRRIGRLPPDKALEIARQLCAGVAAAHEAGVLHRDLKPANVMIDGRGRAHITDFGVAGMLEELRHAAGNPGTPQYMAPEQRLHGEVSVRTDLYAMGLVIYEAFTGRRLDPTAARPTAVVDGLNPQVERMILRCLAGDPAQRPASALEVASVFPGGDMLAAALAAGETPSPEVVAAAGGEGALDRAPAWLLLGGVAASIAMVLLLSQSAFRLGLAPMETTPEELSGRARAIAQKLGYADPPADTASWFDSNTEFLRDRFDFDVHRANPLPSQVAYKKLAEAEQTVMLFRYRQSPQAMRPSNPLSQVTLNEPALSLAGMIELTLDTRGRLLDFAAVPPQVAVEASSNVAPDWSALLAESGLDLARFEKETAVWTPPFAYDSLVGWRAAYTGSGSEDARPIVHVVAAAYRGRPVYFAVIAPWNHPAREQPASRTGASAVAANIWVACVMIAIVAGILLVRRNLRLGRGDPAGAWRIAVFIFLVYVVANLCMVHHTPSTGGELDVFLKVVGQVAVTTGISWLMYMALEPFVRRRWPQLLIGGERVIAGRFRDPLVGRDVLIGAFAAAASVSWQLTAFSSPGWFDFRHVMPLGLLSPPLGIGTTRFMVALLLGIPGESLIRALAVTLALFLSLLAVRRKWAAMIFTVAIFAATTLGGGNPLFDLITSLTYAAALLFVLGRYGILAAFAHNIVYGLLTQFPLTLNFSLWYAGRSFLAMTLCLGIAIYGFHTALGGKSAFGQGLLDDQ